MVKPAALSTALFYFLPAALIVPQTITFFGVRISWVDITCWVGLAFLLRNSWGARRLILWTLAVGIVSAVSNLYGMASTGYELNLKNFALVKYVATYIGAIAIGFNLPTKKLFENKCALVALCALFGMSVVAVSSPRFGMMLGEAYGQENLLDAAFRLRFMDANPNMVGQLATVLTILTVVASKDSYGGKTLALLLGTTIVFVTASRGNLLILALFVLIHEAQDIRKGRAKRALTLSLTVFILILSFHGYFSSLLLPERTSRLVRIKEGLQSRIEVFRAGTRDFYDAPLLGKGYRSRSQIGGEYFNYGGTSSYEAHSQWVGFLFNHGLVGFFVLGGFCLVLGKQLLRIYKKSRHSRSDRHLFRTRQTFVDVYLCYTAAMLGWETLHLPLFSCIFFVFFGNMNRVYCELAEGGNWL